MTKYFESPKIGESDLTCVSIEFELAKLHNVSCFDSSIKLYFRTTNQTIVSRNWFHNYSKTPLPTMQLFVAHKHKINLAWISLNVRPFRAGAQGWQVFQWPPSLEEVCDEVCLSPVSSAVNIALLEYTWRKTRIAFP